MKSEDTFEIESIRVQYRKNDAKLKFQKVKNTIMKMVALDKYHESFFVPNEYLSVGSIRNFSFNDPEMKGIKVALSVVKEPVKGCRVGVKK
jgi:ribosomal protein L10